MFEPKPKPKNMLDGSRTPHVLAAVTVKSAAASSEEACVA